MWQDGLRVARIDRVPVLRPAALAGPRPLGGCGADRSDDAVRSARDFNGPVDSRSESGNKRGEHDRMTDSKSFIMSDVQEFYS